LFLLAYFQRVFKETLIIDISINRDTGVRRAIYVMNSGIFNKWAMPPHLPRTIPNSTLKRLWIKKDFGLSQRFLMKILLVQNAPQKSPRIT
jgi:hypothetical protein